MKTFGRLTRGLIGLLLMGTVLTLAVKCVPRERDLLAEATRIHTPRQWWYGGEELPFIFYEWISDHTLLTHEGGIWLNRLFLFDIRTGKKTLLPELNALLYRFSDCRPHHPNLSPDRQWLLWTTEFRNSVFLAKLDGSHYQENRLPGRGDTVGAESWWSNEEWIAKHGDYQSGKTVAVFTGNRNAPGKVRSLSQAEISEWETPQDKPIPPTMLESNDTDAALDETGQRLVYLSSAPSSPSYLAWMKRLLPGFWHQPDTRLEMWTSRPDGAERQYVGAILRSKTDDENSPEGLRWLPDGKHISFVYKGDLYVVPVN